jgi:catechol 2,3-dioxygenase-like lactoylglutathione lyase family enzyme
MARVRYITSDVDAALSFYTELLGFEVMMHPAPTFAILTRQDLQLVLSGAAGPGGGAQPMPDGRVPEPGGWNRIMLEVSDLEAEVERLRAAGASFRNDILTGIGAKQILLDDPSGNAVELYEALSRES